MAAEPMTRERPSDAVLARLDDPQVADNLLLLLDNLDALAFLALGVSGLLERGDTVTESLADGVRMLTGDGAAGDLDELKASAQRAMATGRTFLDHSEDVQALLDSEVLSSEAVEVLDDAAYALVEGRRRSAARTPEVTGPLSLLRVLRDPDLQQGLQFVLEVGRALGRRTSTPQRSGR